MRIQIFFCATAFVTFLIVTSAFLQAKTKAKLDSSPIEAVVAEMTLQEKVKLVRGAAEMVDNSDGPQVGIIRDRVPGAAGTTSAIPRLGIPSIVFADGPAGVRIAPTREDEDSETFYATAFPIATLLASSWNESLVEEMGRAIGEEAKEYGIDVLLAPALNIHRHALGGRNFEYFSEDPLVSGKLAAAYIKGVQLKGVGTTVKHFVANNHEWNRDQLNVKLDSQTFREIYLRGFELAIKESEPWAVMSSYNKVNGEYTSESEFILRTILRDQWGFDGIVMTDWYGGDNSAMQMRAGNDLLMPGNDGQENEILQAVMAEQLDMAVLDRNVTNILKLIKKTHTFKQYKFSDKPDLAAHAQLAQKVALEGIVLLKNQQNVLPFSNKMSVALLGNNSYQTEIGGTGSGDVNEQYSISIEQGLSAAGIKLDASLKNLYERHITSETAKLPILKHPLADMMPKPAIDEYMITAEEAEALAQQHDIAVLTLGRNSGEFIDRPKNDFYLTEQEKNLVSVVSGAFSAEGKALVIILNVGGVIETANWQGKADAILLAHQPGQEAGVAIANILLGKHNPSGKLASTWPLSLSDYPSDKGFPGLIVDEHSQANPITGSQPSEVIYHEGVFNGYRYFDTFEKPVAYPFGFGLSYTNFTYQDIQIVENDGDDVVRIDVTIKNAGNVAGKEIVQLYIGGAVNDTHRPKKELRDFAKTKLLQPGESQNIRFNISADEFLTFNATSNQWEAKAGEYNIYIAESIEKIQATKRFSLKSTVTLAL